MKLLGHLLNKKSSLFLQNAIFKYGLDKFNFCVFEFLTYEVVSHKALTGLETSNIEKHPSDRLCNFMRTATSLAGYKNS